MYCVINFKFFLNEFKSSSCTQVFVLNKTIVNKGKFHHFLNATVKLEIITLISFL